MCLRGKLINLLRNSLPNQQTRWKSVWWLKCQGRLLLRNVLIYKIATRDDAKQMTSYNTPSSLHFATWTGGASNLYIN